jgi:hypothetical protein
MNIGRSTATRRPHVICFRKTFNKDDVPDILFADEHYIAVGKYVIHQNERCYGYSLEVIPDEKKLKQFPKTPSVLWCLELFFVVAELSLF